MSTSQSSVIFPVLVRKQSEVKYWAWIWSEDREQNKQDLQSTRQNINWDQQTLKDTLSTHSDLPLLLLLLLANNNAVSIFVYIIIICYCFTFYGKTKRTSVPLHTFMIFIVVKYATFVIQETAFTKYKLLTDTFEQMMGDGRWHVIDINNRERWSGLSTYHVHPLLAGWLGGKHIHRINVFSYSVKERELRAERHLGSYSVLGRAGLSHSRLVTNKLRQSASRPRLTPAAIL